MKNKRGVSQVIATVLLILITIAAVILIAGLLIPWVKNSLPETSCVDVLGMLEIAEDKTYTCYDSVNMKAKVMLKLGFADVEVRGLIIVLSGEGESKRFEIIKGENAPDGVSMIGEWRFPEQGESRTYIFDFETAGIGFSAEKAESALIIGKDSVCESVSMNLPACL